MSSEPTLNVILFQPEIPQNTGNIGRTCVSLNAKLWIVRPTGFRIDEKQVQRAGLDYWQHLNWQAVDSWQHMLPHIDESRLWLFTKFGTTNYSSVKYQRGDWLLFGSETSGLPQTLRSNYESQCVSLPMIGPVRSLNLSVSVGIGMYEAYRQIAG
ncbi:MAG: tRNA (cytidine(34)-2'-O)-methyltransferase [Pirellula sp.]|nr:tRNA (cytidine(34)-2'-O)-methyltransferase [Pirellula sp.]